MSLNAQINAILNAAHAEGRSSLLEHEVYSILDVAGCRTPSYVLVKPDAPLKASTFSQIGGTSVMLKIVSPMIAHKTDVGGVAKVANEPKAIAEGIARMLAEVPARQARYIKTASASDRSEKELAAIVTRSIRGVLVVERIAIEGQGVGSEVIVALRQNREFGPVLTMGVGGVDTELLGGACKKGAAIINASTELSDETAILKLFRSTLAYQRLAGLTREKKKWVDDSEFTQLITALRALASVFGNDGEGEGWTITELEVNPFVVSGGKLFALDGLLKFRKRHPLPLPRPQASVEKMLLPSSIAIMGVSSKGMNLGRIILGNMKQAGFDPMRMYIVRPETPEIDGVPCVPSIKDLPERVDLFVVAVSAEQVPGIVEELAQHDKAVGVILIPGGMGEKEGGKELETRLHDAIKKARLEGKPLVANGGNCIGIISRPGHYHTVFIPQTKLPLREDGRSNVALISQSGAFMISRISNMGWLSPRYAISTGNQNDLTMTDFVRQISRDPEVKTFAVYAEGFQDSDGLTFAKAVKEITASGRDVIFYKGGKTTEGKTATSGHTASLAGDYDVCESILKNAGAYVARTFGEFQSLLKISSLLGGKSWKGTRLGATSNAGYESVGISDALRGEGWDLTLAHFTDATRTALQGVLKQGKLDTLVDVHNPMDLTPMATDEIHAATVSALLADPDIDAVLCAMIPLPEVNATLADQFGVETSLPNRLKALVATAKKPVVACIDCGALFDPFVQAFEGAGIPCFRSSDEAVKTIGLYAAGRVARG